MSKEQNPKMPGKGKRPYLVLHDIPSELMFDSGRFSSGSMGMGMERVDITYLDADGVTRTKIGYLDLCVGGGIIVHDDRSKRTYGINPLDIWKAYDNAKDKEIVP